MSWSSNVQPQQLDPNMRTHSLQGDWEWYSPLTPPFQVYGFPWLAEEGIYRRLPLNPKEALPSAIDRLANCTAGGQIRFRTDAERVAVRVRLGGTASMDHMPATGQNGFDAYIGEPGRERYVGTSRMKLHESGYECILFSGSKPDKLRTVTLNFPLYQSVSEVAVGVAAGAAIEADETYRSRGRIVFYGTSITQGGCAGRPGLAYPQQIGRALAREVINLGFSGNGKGEAELAAVIGTISRVDCFVVDYEANCSTELYMQTLEPFIRQYRSAQREVPILVVSRIPYAKELLDRSVTAERKKRLVFAKEVVGKLYRDGDERIAFVDGSRLLGKRYDECTVDGVHPNDLGFTRMANGLLPAIQKIIGEP
ncbi:hypothetical protein DVH26_16495 [Paenibacillus sp. H1-7]|uniref:SGNH/GDSL hydrolase family protein n=1 Tax=Paenibacillus sp. H1-7 TaxID=2282849 RepID=UPI001EF95CD6|nr:SGNH/GDSL hydrolase family protein [Paenibacillus sp. H1-7]ULL15901.1 hypothetical protein DVH26_16495 [Paenibacillus sp. H1-7]